MFVVSVVLLICPVVLLCGEVDSQEAGPSGVEVGRCPHACGLSYTGHSRYWLSDVTAVLTTDQLWDCQMQQHASTNRLQLPCCGMSGPACLHATRRAASADVPVSWQQGYSMVRHM